MSRSIDERVVSMQFDNKKFEKNVEETTKTLKRFKETTDSTFKTPKTNGLSDAIANLANSKSFSKIAENLDSIASKFTVLGQWANRKMQEVIGSIENGVKTLSIDQVSAGWQKYADKTSAVQTIMAATAKDFSDTGKQMEYVNKQMDKLNWFTDETSYNFVDMVSNIGKFTSNDVKLDTAVTAMQGISTWAAVSGANAENASRAMYNLSQALGTGAVKLQDWMSIENANMATTEFKETVIETALALGKLEKKKNGLIYVKGTKKTVSTANFRENLSSGWFTSDVLMQSLDKYGSFTDKLYELTDKTGTTATEFLGYIEDYQNGTLDMARTAKKLGITSEELSGYLSEATDESYKLGLKAFKAAQEAKTFEEAINSVKDAVSTGWMNTFELIFGDYQEAKKLWTDFANTLWDIFAAGGEARNELLRGWRNYEIGIKRTYKGTYNYSEGTNDLILEAVESIETLDGRVILLEGIGNAFESLAAVMNAVKYSFRSVFPPMTVERLMNLTIGFRDLTEKVKSYVFFSEDLLDLDEENTDAFNQMSKPVAVLVKALRGLFSIGRIVIDVLKDIGNSIFSVFASKPRLLYQIGDIISWIGDKLYQLKDNLRDNAVYQAFIESIRSSFSTIVFYAGKALIKVKNFANLINNKLIENGFWEKLEKGLVSFFKDFPGFIESVFQSIDNFFSMDVSGEESFFGKIKKRFSAFSGISDWIKQKFATIGINFESIGKILDILFSPIKWIFSVLSGVKDNLGEWTSENLTLKNILDAIGKLLSVAGSISWFKALWGVGNLGKNLRKGLESIGDGIGDLFGGITNIFNGGSSRTWADKIFKVAEALGILAVAITVLASKDPERLKGAVIALGVMASGLLGFVYVLEKISDNKKAPTVQKIAKSFIPLSTSLLILSFALKKISDLSWEEIERGLVGLGGVLLELAVFVLLISNLQKKKVKLKGIIGLAISLLLLSKVLKDISTLGWEEIERGLVGLGGVLLELSVAMILMSRFGKKNLALKSFLGIGIALLSCFYVFDKMKSLNWEEIERGLVGLGGVLLELSVAMILMSKAGKMKVSSLASLLLLSFAISNLSKVMVNLSDLSWIQIKKGLATIGGIGLILTAFGSLLSKASTYMPKLSTLLKMFLILGVLALSISSFLKIVKNLDGYNAEDIMKKMKSFVFMIGGIGAITAAMGVAAKHIGLGNMTKGAIALAIGALAADIVAIGQVITLELIGSIDKYFTDQNGSQNLRRGAQIFRSTMEAIGPFIAVNEGMDVLLAGVETYKPGFLGKVAVASLVNALSSLCSDISAILHVVSLEVIGVLDDIFAGEENTSKIEQGAQAFKTTMEAVGGFLGVNDAENAIGGIIEAIVKALTKGEGSFAGGVAKMAGSNLISSLASDISAIMDVVTLELIGVIDEKFAGDDSSKIERGAEVFKTTMEAVGSFVNDTAATTLLLGLAGSAGVKAAAFGLATVSISVLSAGIAALGSVLIVELAGAIDDWFTDEKDPSSGIEKGAEVLKKTKEALDNFIGAANIGTVDEAMDYADTTIYKLVGAVNGLITDIITDLAIVVDGAVLLAAKWAFGNGRINEAKEVVEGIGSAIGGFFGNVTGSYEGTRDASKLREFSGALGDFGTNLNTFTTNLEPFDEDLVMSAARVGDVFAELEKSLTEQGGIKQWFLGEKDIGEFGDRLRTFGDGLNGLATSIDDAQITQIGKVIGAAQSVIDLAKNAEDFNSWGFANLSYDLTQMATSGFDAFVAVFSDEEGQMKTEGVGLIGKLCEGIEESFETVETDGKQTISHFCTGILNAWPLIETFAGISGSTFESNLKSSVSGTYQIGSDAAAGYLNGLKSKLSQIKSVASQIGQVTKSALRSSIDSHSPSRDAYEIASDFVAGYNNSLRDSLPYIGYAAQALGEESILSLEEALAQLSNLIDSDMDVQPTITPVFDMSNLDGAMALMNDGLETQKTLDVTASKAIVRNAEAVSNSQIKMGSYNDAGVIKAISDLTNRVDNLNDSMASMRIVLDTGATVGALAPAMDKQLGQRATYKGRGN